MSREIEMILFKRAETLAGTQSRTAVLFLAPTFLVLAAVGLYPLSRTIWLSFTDANFFSDEARFVYFDNYLDLHANPEWWAALYNTIFFAVVGVALQVALGIAFAMVLNVHFFGRKFARAANLIPLVIALTVASQLWKWMYHDVFGVVNDALLRLGIIHDPVAWLNDPDTALWAIIMMSTWKFVPFVTLLILAALQGIPKELYEAAEIDGAGPIARFWRVTLPLLKDAIAVVVVFRMLDALRVFDIVYVMTGNSPATVTISMYARQQMIEFGLVGAGSAASVEIFLLIILGTIIYMRMLKVEDR
jgi:trehalose/maltose transport system permease protein